MNHHSAQLPFAKTSGTYGLAPNRRVEPARGLKVFVQVTVFAAFVSFALAFGAGCYASQQLDLEAWRRVTRVDAMVEDTMDLIAACALDDLDELDGCCFHEGGQIDNGDFRVELAVSADPAGYEVRATLIDNRTRRAIKRFVTWRGRT